MCVCVWQRALRVPSYLSLITRDALLFCGGSATWRCDVHANEAPPVCGGAYGRGRGRRGWRDTSQEARVGPPLTATDKQTHGGGEGGGGAHVLHSLLLPSSTCQRLSQSPQTGKTEVFSPLRRYQEIIICCSAFHADNQERASQTTKQASARRDGGGGWGCMEKKYVFLLRETTGPRVAELICFWKNALVASSICCARNQER